MESSQITFLKALKAGTIAGLLGAGANNLWSLIASSMEVTIPQGFALAVTISSIFPVIIGALIYFGLARFTSKAMLIWYVLGIGFTLFSFFPVFTTTQLPDGTVVDSTFPILVGPMHVVSGVLATWGIPRWSK
jgi:hypothetical protein